MAQRNWSNQCSQTDSLSLSSQKCKSYARVKGGIVTDLRSPHVKNGNITVVISILLVEDCMKASYGRDSDALLIHVGRGKVVHAEEMSPFIIHFTRRGRPLLIEILDASEILSNLGKITMRSKKAIPVKLT